MRAYLFTGCLAVAALAIFFRWFGGEHRADRGIESRLGVR